jgi:hypothetical protein
MMGVFAEFGRAMIQERFVLACTGLWMNESSWDGPDWMPTLRHASGKL